MQSGVVRVEFAIARQIGLRHDAKDALAMDDNRGLEEVTLGAFGVPTTKIG